MGLVRPRSFVTLIVAGFVLVTLPLLAAVVTSSLQVDRLARHSENAVHRTVQVTHGGRMLVEQVTSMERNARQYQVLQDPSRLAAYENLQRELQATLERIEALHPDLAQRVALGELLGLEQEIYAHLRTYPPDSEESRLAVTRFPELAARARSVLAEGEGVVGREVESLREMASQAQRLLFWQTLALVPMAIGLAVWFLRLITRPVAQIDQAIRRLGDGEFYTPVKVLGPRDMERLGQRLDWMRARLLELEEEKKRFLRHVSHELKTPLTAVREGSELLVERVLGPLNAQQEEVARILQQNALRLQRLIEDLLSFSRSPDGKMRLAAAEAVRLDELAQTVLREHKVALLTKGLAVDFAGEPALVSGDPARLKAILENLVSNAIKYSPQGGDLHVAVSAGGDEVAVDVRDHGPGIPEEERGRVFDAFYQGRLQPGGPVRGTGLGLAIVRECALAHGGDVRILDEAAGGTHLRVTLPRHWPASAGAEEPGP